jgi:hypothetical protein
MSESCNSFKTLELALTTRGSTERRGGIDLSYREWVNLTPIQKRAWKEIEKNRDADLDVPFDDLVDLVQRAPDALRYLDFFEPESSAFEPRSLTPRVFEESARAPRFTLGPAQTRLLEAITPSITLAVAPAPAVF